MGLHRREEDAAGTMRCTDADYAEMEAMLMAFVDDVRSQCTASEPLPRLRQLAAAHVRWRLQHPAIAEVFDIALGVRTRVNSLPEEHRRRIRAIKRMYVDELRAVLNAGKRSGTFDFADVRVTAFAIVTLCGSAHTWYDPRGRPDGRPGRGDVRRLRRGHGARADARRVAVGARRPPRTRGSRGAARRCRAISYPPELPVSARREDLLAAIRDHQVVVVAGETGSGKTTQLPKICLELGRGVERHDRPHAAAPARRAHGRRADRRGAAASPLGEAVGYAVRFSDRSRPDTLVRLMTDGLLLAEIRRDRLLRRYDTIIVDEAHERSLNIDFLLGYLRADPAAPARPEADHHVGDDRPGALRRHFGDAPVVEVSGPHVPGRGPLPPARGRRRPDRDQTDAIGDAVEELLRERPGDVLVFLSRRARDPRHRRRARAAGCAPTSRSCRSTRGCRRAEQQRVFAPHAGRRVVLATNVAETSLTVPGIRYVVDPGTARISRYSARLKVQRLPIEPISQASADQRKGRCGRTSDGICIRLYAEEDFDERPRFTDPEILRTNLAVGDPADGRRSGSATIEDFPFLDPPDRRQVRDGVRAAAGARRARRAPSG